MGGPYRSAYKSYKEIIFALDEKTCISSNERERDVRSCGPTPKRGLYILKASGPSIKADWLLN